MKRTLSFCFLSALAGGAVAAWLLDPHAKWPFDQTASAQFTGAPAVAAPVTVANRSFPQASTEPSTPLTPEEQTNIRVYESTNPSVVNINTKIESHSSFFPMLSLEGSGGGSGSVLDREGHILTNFHVVDDAQDIQVTLSGGKTYPAEVVGFDKEIDIAVLKIDAPASELFPITFGSSDNLKVGQRVYALGNPFGLEGTLTTGIISNLNRTLPSRVKDREIKSVIQTDAALNPGNSGGPLVDTSGRVIGMNFSIASTSGSNAGLGFAIPSNRIARFVPELIEKGKITRPDIGIVAVRETDQGLQILATNKGGPAELAGLRGWKIERRQVRRGPLVQLQERRDPSQADIILAVDGVPVEKGSALLEKIEAHRPGETITLTILREGRQQQVPVTLAATG
jgi:S1-C subfamily serine protease